MKSICIIPARSGSKGLANKNMLFIDGKPLIFHTIQAAIDSDIFSLEDIYVTTDSVQYGDIIKTTGVNVVYREPHVASDSATTFDVLNDFFQNIEEEVSFVLLQPTSPLRANTDIIEAYKIFEKNKFCGNVVSFSKVSKNPILNSVLDENNIPVDIIGVDKGYRRQDSKEYFYPNGAIFISSKTTYLTNKSFFTADTVAYLMESRASIDIDDIDDFYHAVGSLYFNYQKREQKNKEMYKKTYHNFAINHLEECWILGDSRMLDFTIKGYSNLSIGGVTLATMKENISDLLSQKVPKKVFISLGVNDLITKYSLVEIKENFIEVISLLQNNNIEIIISKVIFTLFNAAVSNSEIQELNNFLVDFCKQKQIILLNAEEILCENNCLKYCYTIDGLHFNDQGKKLLLNYYNDNL